MKQRLKWGRLMKKPENENLTLLSVSRRLSANSWRQWYYSGWGGGIRGRKRVQIKQQPELKKSHFTVPLEALHFNALATGFSHYTKSHWIKVRFYLVLFLIMDLGSVTGVVFLLKVTLALDFLPQLLHQKYPLGPLIHNRKYFSNLV